MKLFLVLSFLLLATTLPSPAASQAAVRDTDGQIVLAGQQYYMMPFQTPRGMTYTSLSNSTCATYISESNVVTEYGVPVVFSPVRSAYGIVREETDLNIQFVPRFGSQLPSCGVSMVWRVATIPFAGQFPRPRIYVQLGGMLGLPGPMTVANWFKILNTGDGGTERDSYKLRYCPEVCPECQGVCADIGSSLEADNQRWIGIGGEEFPVVFKKALT